MKKLGPGDTLVVRSSEGGCDRFGWAPVCTAPVRDIGDDCANARAKSGGGRYRLRIHPDVLFPEDASRRDEIRAMLSRAREEESNDELQEFAEEWLDEPCGKPRSYTTDGVLVLSRKVNNKVPAEVDETDERDSSSFTEKKSLSAHTDGVVEKAVDFAAGCGVDSAVALAVEVAAILHDYGKCDARFQYVLNPQWEAARGWFAKGDDCSRREYERRVKDSGYPSGARHEFVSAALAEASEGWERGCDRDLAIHLIGTHHGHGRAMAPVWTGGDYDVCVKVAGSDVTVPASAQTAQLDSGWTDRYWALTRKYGWWGLAYLEAILRRADCVQSREEQQ